MTYFLKSSWSTYIRNICDAVEKVLYLMPRKQDFNLNSYTHTIQVSWVSVFNPKMVQVVIAPHCWFVAKSKKASESICHNYGSQWVFVSGLFWNGFVELMLKDRKKCCERILTMWDPE